MKHFVGIFLLACMGCYTQVTRAASYDLSTLIKIQSCNDFTYLTIPPLNGPATIAPTTAETTTMPPTTTGPTGGTTTEPPVPVIPISGGNGVSNVIWWQVNWARAVNSTSIVSAWDKTTKGFRVLGWDAVIGLAVKNQGSFSGEVISDYVWNFQSVFDSASWTYKYLLKLNGGSDCLCRRGGAWSRAPCTTGSDNKAILFNLITS